MLRARQWLQKGRWVLLIGPFIPGLRNLMGYVAGASGLRMQTYARFAYSGALLSSTTFVTFGYVAGRHVHWNHSILPLVALGLILKYFDPQRPPQLQSFCIFERQSGVHSRRR
jgi:membrane protein DedA with SNARE-associated domain